MELISVVLAAACCQSLLGEVGGELTLSIVISAGQVRDTESRVRELAVFLRNFEPEQIEHGVLIIRGNNEGNTEAAEIRIRDRIVQKTRLSARVFTNIKFQKTNWTSSNHPATNLGYCCELRVNGSIAATGCLRLQPRWMEEMLPELGLLPMRSLALPGTHQSGTFAAKVDYKTLYRDCQEEDIYTQLLYGIRAFDLRPGAVTRHESPYYGYDYWIFHDKFSTDNSLKWILMDVKLFLDEYPNEVVIVDFHEFPNGFGRDTAYLGLEMLVDEVLGNYIFRRNTTAPTMMTLAEVIRSGQRALLTFQKNGYLQEKYLPGVEHIWANTDYLEILRERLRRGQSSRNPDRFYSSMVEITAQGFWSILFDRYGGGVRGVAHRDNFEISSWYSEDETMRENASIIAMDYFASSDIVEICKSINRERIERVKRDLHL